MSEQVREAAAAREQAERTLRDMKEFIEEAKVVDKRNCRLDAQMSTEIARRKKLHDYVEDLKGKIRVYVRVRPMSTTEVERACQVAYTKNHDASLTYFPHDGFFTDNGPWREAGEHCYVTADCVYPLQFGCAHLAFRSSREA